MPDFAQIKPTLRWQFVFEGSWPTAVAFVNQGQRLAAANQLGQIFVWDLSSPAGESADQKPQADKAPSLNPARMLVGHTNGVTRLQATSDGQTLFSASLDHTIRVWNMAAEADGEAEVVLDADTREQQARRAGKKDPPAAPGIKVATQGSVAVLEGHEDWVSALAISRDGKRLVSGDYGSRVIVWDTSTRKEIARWSGRPWNWIVAAALSADGQMALVSENRYKRDDFDIPSAAVRLWNVADAKETLDILKIQFPKYDPTATSYGAAQGWRKWVAAGLIAADVSPDGKLLALGQGGETDTGVVHLIDAATGKLVRDIAGHQYGVTDARFSDDGEYILSTGRDTSLRICRVSDGKEVHQLHKPRGGQFKDWLSSLAISSHNRWLAATDIAGLVHVWSLE